MKTLFSTLLLAFAVVMVSCGSKTAKAAEETAVAPETEVVVEKTCTCEGEEAKECTCEEGKCTKTEDGKCSKATEEEAAKKAE